MRTLDELLEVAKNAQAEHAAKVAAAEHERQEVLAAIEQAKADAEQAAADGDQAAYEKARQAEGFNISRAAFLRKQTISPRFTKEEHNALMEELRTLFNAGCAPHYQRIVEALDVIKQERKAIAEVQSKAGSAAWIVRNFTGEPLSGVQSAWYNSLSVGISAFVDDVCRKYSTEKERLYRLAGMKED